MSSIALSILTCAVLLAAYSFMVVFICMYLLNNHAYTFTYLFYCYEINYDIQQHFVLLEMNLFIYINGSNLIFYLFYLQLYLISWSWCWLYRYRIYDDDVLSSSSEAEMRKQVLQKSALPPKVNGAMSPTGSFPSSPSRWELQM